MADPRGFTVRPARPGDEDGIAAVHVATWRATYRGVIAAGYLRRLSVAGRRRMWRAAIRRPSPLEGLVVACEAGGAGRLVGYGAAGPQRDDGRLWDGEFYALYVLPGAQGAGLGRAMMTRLARALVAAGCGSADVWALKENVRAHRFYRRLGGVPEASRPMRFGGQRLVETAHVWPDLAAAFAGGAER